MEKIEVKMEHSKVEPIQETAFDAEDPDLESSEKSAIDEQNAKTIEKSESDMSFLDNWNLISDEEKRLNLGYFIAFPFVSIWIFLSKHDIIAGYVFKFLIFAGYWIFTGFALSINYHEGLVLLIIGVVNVVFIIWDTISPTLEKAASNNLSKWKPKHTHWLHLGLGIAFFLFVIIFVFVDSLSPEIKKSKNLLGLAGIILYIVISIIFSAAPHKIVWRPVLWGFALQFIVALIVLRTHWGFVAFDFVGRQVSKFLSFSSNGARFVFGSELIAQFAFGVAPIIIFMSMITAMLYYIGFMNYIIGKVSWLFEITCATTGPESMVVVGNIFLGQTESPLLVQPYLEDMTESEMFVVMCSGLASVAGSVMGAFIAMGVSPVHLLSAALMSAPASLAISKVLCPETSPNRLNVPQSSGVKTKNEFKTNAFPASNLLEAATVGISMSIAPVAGILFSLIGFVSFQYFLDDVIGWLGESVGKTTWSFDLLLAYIFYPFVYFMGVDEDEILVTSKLVGQKTFFNEFIAYDSLSKMINLRKEGTQRCDESGNILWLSERSESLATYALCGFSNFASIGILNGVLRGLAPSQGSTIIKYSFLALYGATIACFCTGCVVSMLYGESEEPFLWGDVDLRDCEYTGWNSCNITCNTV